MLPLLVQLAAALAPAAALDPARALASAPTLSLARAPASSLAPEPHKNKMRVNRRSSKVKMLMYHECFTSTRHGELPHPSGPSKPVCV